MMNAHANAYASETGCCVTVLPYHSRPHQRLQSSACALLDDLRETRRSIMHREEGSRPADLMQRVTGRSALDAAIDEVQTIIDQLKPTITADRLPSLHENQTS